MMHYKGGCIHLDGVIHLTEDRFYINDVCVGNRNESGFVKDIGMPYYGQDLCSWCFKKGFPENLGVMHIVFL